MTPYKILRLFSIHKTFNSDRFKQEKREFAGMDDIDIALGGL